MKNPAKFSKSLLTPKWWPSWLAIALWWTLTQITPFKAQLFLGRQLGRFLNKIGGSRKHIAECNIKACYPELSAQEQEKLVLTVLEETAIGIFESGMAWFWPNWRFKNKYSVGGLEHISYAVEQGRGVLFLGIHFTTIEIGASIVNLETPISGFYKPHKNRVYEYVQAAGRTRRNSKSTVIPNGDVRGIIKSLRSGLTINYAPDQDYGRKRSTFSSFFNIQTATVKAPHQLASAGRAEVIPWVTRRDKQTNLYHIDILPPITKTLGQGDENDANTINALIESHVRQNTHQYLWVHRRFKTRPEGEPPFYK